MKSEEMRRRKELAAVMAHGAAIGKITPARLMSPEELVAALRDRPDLDGKLRGRCLCTEVPPVMWHKALDAQAEGVMPNRMSVAEAPGSGRKYLTIAIQAGEWLHRVCVPLVGRETAQWLDTLVSGVPLQMSVTNGASDRAFVSLLDVPAGTIAELFNSDTSLAADWRELLDEAMSFVAWNATVVDSRSERRTPTEVSASLLFPQEVQAELEMIEEASMGRRPN